MVKYSLKKKERLSSKKQIASLFNEGNSAFKYPYKLFYKIIPATEKSVSPVLFSVSVPKKKIKKAVKRNLIKRRTREAYRLNKYILIDKVPLNKQIILMFVYVGKKPEPYQLVQDSVKQLLGVIVN
jgi:ribonuclease P protein component